MFLYLTTVGRRTGLSREIEIWFTERDGRFYIIAEHRERAAYNPERPPFVSTERRGQFPRVMI